MTLTEPTLHADSLLELLASNHETDQQLKTIAKNTGMGSKPYANVERKSLYLEEKCQEILSNPTMLRQQAQMIRDQKKQMDRLLLENQQLKREQTRAQKVEAIRQEQLKRFEGIKVFSAEQAARGIGTEFMNIAHDLQFTLSIPCFNLQTGEALEVADAIDEALKLRP